MDVTALTSAASANASTGPKDMSELTSEDFLKLLVSELTQQDPFEPMKNQDLMNQINAIRDMESSSTLTETLSSFAFKSSLSAAAGVIGKSVVGMTDSGDKAAGIVSGVRVSEGNVLLDLDSGQVLKMDNIREIFDDPTAAEAQAAALVAALDGTATDTVTQSVAGSAQQTETA